MFHVGQVKITLKGNYVSVSVSVNIRVSVSVSVSVEILASVQL